MQVRLLNSIQSKSFDFYRNVGKMHGNLVLSGGILEIKFLLVKIEALRRAIG